MAQTPAPACGQARRASSSQILYGYAPSDARLGRGATGWHGDDAQTSVLEFDRPRASRARLIEFDPRYCDVIVARYERLSGDRARKVS